MPTEPGAADHLVGFRCVVPAEYEQQDRTARFPSGYDANKLTQLDVSECSDYG